MDNVKLYQEIQSYEESVPNDRREVTDETVRQAGERLQRYIDARTSEGGGDRVAIIREFRELYPKTFEVYGARGRAPQE